MDLTKEAVMKRASSYLRKLAEEVKSFRKQEEKDELINSIIKKTPGSLSGSEFISKRASLKEKELEELKLTDKALDLTKESGLSLGEVSKDKPDGDQFNPLIRALLKNY